MAGREGRLGVDHVGERLADRVDAGRVEHEHAIGRLQLQHQPRHVVAHEIGPQRVAGADREERFRHLGIEPAPAPLPHHLLRGREAMRREEHLGRLAQARDAREQRDLLARHAGRLTAPVPVLVERPDGVGAGIREAEAPDDRRPAVAASLDDRLALGDQGAQHRERALSPRDAAARRHVLRRVARDLHGLRPVDELAVRLESDVVGAEQLAHAGGRRRAADVLEQERVVEGIAVIRSELQLVREAHADQAGALGLPDGMPLGHVERVRERRDDLGLTNLIGASLHELHACSIGGAAGS